MGCGASKTEPLVVAQKTEEKSKAVDNVSKNPTEVHVTKTSTDDKELKNEPQEDLKQLKSFAVTLETAHRVLEKSQPNLTTRNVVEQIILQEFTKGNSVAESLPRNEVGRPHLFVSHAWSSLYKSTNELLDYFDTEIAPYAGISSSPLLYWQDIYSLNQKGDSVLNRAACREALSNAKVFILCLDSEGLTFTRLWCLFELWSFVKAHGQDNIFILAPNNDLASLSKAFMSLDINASLVTKDDDKKWIFTEFGVDASNVLDLNEFLRSSLQQIALQQAYSIEKFKVGDTMLRLRHLTRVCRLLKAFGKAVEAEPLIRLAYEELKEKKPADDIDRIAAAEVLALILHDLDRLSEASYLLESVCAFRTRLQGESHPDTAAAFSSLAWLYNDIGDLNRAEELQRKVIAAAPSAWGETTAQTADACTALASMLSRAGKNDEAEVYMRQALGIRTAMYGEGSALMAGTYINLGSLCFTSKRFEEANTFFRTALRMQRQRFGEESIEAAKVLFSLGSLLEAQAQYEEAEALFKMTVKIKRKALGANHKETKATMVKLAVAMIKQNKVEEARPIWTEVLAVADPATMGPTSPSGSKGAAPFIADYMTIATALEAAPIKAFEDAVAVYESALELQIASLGPDDPACAKTMVVLGSVMYDQAKYAEAEMQYRRALAVREKVLGSSHPDTATVLNNLASALNLQGKYPEAAPLYQRALELQIAALGQDHAHVAASMNNLAVVYYRQGEYAKAEPLFQSAYEIFAQQYGPQHPSTSAALLWLDYTVSAMSKENEDQPFLESVVEDEAV